MRPHVMIDRHLQTDTVHVSFLSCSGPFGFIVTEEQFRALGDAMEREREKRVDAFCDAVAAR